MDNFMKLEDNAEFLASIPKDLPILPIRNTVAYPFALMSLPVGFPCSVQLVEDALKGNRVVGLVTMKDGSVEELQPGQTCEIGTIAMVYHVIRGADKTLQVVIQGLERFSIEHWLDTEPYLTAHIALKPDEVEPGLELYALQRSLRDLAQGVVALSPNLPEQVGNLLNQVEDPRYLTYLVAANLGLEVEKAQQILEADSVRYKLRALVSHLSREKEVLTLGQKIRTEAREEMDRTQRDYYLRQQLKAIQKELGETDESRSAAAEYTEKIERPIYPRRRRRRHSVN